MSRYVERSKCITQPRAVSSAPCASMVQPMCVINNFADHEAVKLVKLVFSFLRWLDDA